MRLQNSVQFEQEKRLHDKMRDDCHGNQAFALEYKCKT